jgi:hypothetical protein
VQPEFSELPHHVGARRQTFTLVDAEDAPIDADVERQHAAHGSRPMTP